MKLIACKKCSDVFRLFREDRKCKCGESGGQYVDNINAIIYGDCIPIGFANSSFISALRNQPKEGWGANFEAFVIPSKCDSIEHKNN